MARLVSDMTSCPVNTPGFAGHVWQWPAPYMNMLFNILKSKRTARPDNGHIRVESDDFFYTLPGYFKFQKNACLDPITFLPISTIICNNFQKFKDSSLFCGHNQWLLKLSEQLYIIVSPCVSHKKLYHRLIMQITLKLNDILYTNISRLK